MIKILLLEDDKLFSSTMEDFLEEEGYGVDVASSGEEALEYNYNKNYDLYIFDINLPKISGLEVLSNLRGSSDNTPTIFLTSYKDKDTLHKAFLSGCDDYIKKPVDLEELSLRIKALLKRDGKLLENIQLGDNLYFDISQKRLYKNGVDLNLSLKVAELFELLLERKGNIVTKEMIINKLWSTSEGYSEGSIRVYINQLKKILGKNTISNIKGVGYRYEL